MKTFFQVIILFLLIGCEPILEENFRIFTIKAGNHYADQRHLESLQTDQLVFEARFDSSAVYEFSEKGFQDSKNKLLGFSDCNAMHHEHSARFAWQWYNNTIEIYAYCYNNGNRIEAYLGSVDPGEIARYSLRLSKNKYIFDFEDSHVEINRDSDCTLGAYVMLWPYFGGEKAAPHDINVYIRRY